MDDETLKKIVAKQLSILPEDVLILFESGDISAKTQWVGKKYNLRPDQISTLENETMLVLLGLSHLMDFMQNVETELQIPKEQARLVAQEMGMQLFSSVKNSLRELSKSLEVENTVSPNTTTPIATVQGVQMQKENLTPETQENITQATVRAPASEGILGRGMVVSQQNPTINKDTLLKEIEHPALIKDEPKETAYEPTIIDQKLRGVMKIPREEVKVNTDGYKGVDPYREPIE